ncbi:MAG: PAS domain-containing protein, partial [Pseudomonadota bacterium]
MDRLPVADSGEDVYTTLSLYEIALRQANIAFWAWNENVEEAYLISDLLYEILEIPKSKYLQDLEFEDPVYQVIHPDDVEEYQHVDQLPPYEKHAYGDTDSYHIDYRIIATSGRVKYLREYGHTLRDSSGRVIWTYGTIQDISDLKETEYELNIAQRISSVGSWIWSVDDDRLVSCTQEFARIHGVSMDEVHQHMGRQMERVIHPDDRDRMVQEFADADKGNSDYEATYRIIRPDGEIRLIREIGEFIPDKKDAKRTLQRGVIQDITDQSRAEQTISRQSDLLNLLYEVTRAANETNTLENAMKTCLEKVCSFQHWPVGHFYWRSDEHDDQFVSSNIWYCKDRAQYQPFIDETDRLKVPSSGGLVEQVVASEESQWIVDFNALDGFAARDDALTCGLKCGYAVPVYCDGEIVAVTEFFTDQRIKPDLQLIETLDHMASQLSQVFIRRRHEQSLELALISAKQSS